MGLLLKLLKRPRNPRSIVGGALILSVGGCCAALVVRGTLWLRTPSAVALAPSMQVAPAPLPKALEDTGPSGALEIGERVLTRNIFDSATGALSWDLAPPASAAQPTTVGSDEGTASAGARCSGDLRLLASVMNARDPRRSLVALRKDGKTHIVTLGEQLGELTLVALQPTEAFFRIGESPCSLPVYLSANGSAPPPPPAPPPEAAAHAQAEPAPTPGRRPPAFSEDELKRNIRVLGPARYAVTRELFGRARMNPSGLSRGARFKPRLEDGRSSGMEVSKLREDSLLAHLGVKQGDVLRGINGFSLGSADGVLEAFGHLGKKSQVSLSIERGGALTTIEYVLE